MRKLSLILAAALLAPVGAVGTAAAQVARPASGRVQMTVHTHSAGVLLFPVERLPFNFTTGDTFSYSSRLAAATPPSTTSA